MSAKVSKRAPKRHFTSAKIIEILVDFGQLGATATAKKHDVPVRTLYRWRDEKATKDADIGDAVRQRTAEIADGWRSEFVAAARTYARRLDEAMLNLTNEQFLAQLPVFSPAIERLTDAVTASDMMRDEEDESPKEKTKPHGSPPFGDWQSSPAAQAAGRATGIPTGEA